MQVARKVRESQGSSRIDNINALPRGTAGITAFKAYTAESRHVSQVHTVIAEAAVFEAVKHGRALGDASPVTSEDLWDQVAEDMSRKPYKALGMDLVDGARRQHEQAVEDFMHYEHRLQSQRAEGRQHGVEVRARLREEGARAALSRQIGALDEALARNGAAVTELGQEVEAFLHILRSQTAEIARRGVETAERRRMREEKAVQPSFRPRFRRLVADLMG